MIPPEYEALAREIVATWGTAPREIHVQAGRILASARRASVAPVKPLRPRIPAQRRAAA